MIVFSGGVYVGENSPHEASVELFACREQPRHKAQCSLFVKEACFFDKLTTEHFERVQNAVAESLDISRLPTALYPI